MERIHSGGDRACEQVSPNTRGFHKRPHDDEPRGHPKWGGLSRPSRAGDSGEPCGGSARGAPQQLSSSYGYIAAGRRDRLDPPMLL